MIKDAESLIQSVEGVNAALVSRRRDDVLRRIDAHITEVEAELDAAQASDDLRNRCLHPLQALKRQVEGQSSIAHINQAQQTAIEAIDEALLAIERAAKAREPQIGEPPPKSYKKPRVVRVASLAQKSLLETQADVDEYLDRLRQALESAINAHERVEIR
jgi:hypothetical protein